MSIDFGPILSPGAFFVFVIRRAKRVNKIVLNFLNVALVLLRCVFVFFFSICKQIFCQKSCTDFRDIFSESISDLVGATGGLFFDFIVVFFINEKMYNSSLCL